MSKFSLSKMREIKQEEIPVMNSIIMNYKRTRSVAKIEYLFKDKINIIAEIKKSSPSHGVFANQITDVMRINSYLNGGASGISILAEEKFFGGSYYSLKKLSANISVPVLCKDFIFYKEQINAAFVCGADIILLIARALSLQELKELYNYTLSLGLFPLVEVTSMEDLHKAIKLQPEAIMVNMRDLENLSINFQRGIEVINKIPEEIKVISASGIECKDDIVNIKSKSKARSFLIGSALMKHHSPDKFIKELKDVC